MNSYRSEGLLEHCKADVNEIHPLRMEAVQRAGTSQQAIAINEVSLHRQTGKRLR